MLSQEQINEANKIMIKMAELSRSSVILKNLETNEVQELVIESINLNNKTKDGVIVKIVDSDKNITDGIYNIFITTKIVNFETLQYIFDKQTTFKNAKIINTNEESFVIDKDNITGKVYYLSANS